MFGKKKVIPIRGKRPRRTPPPHIERRPKPEITRRATRLREEETKYNKHTAKGIAFFSASSVGDCKQLLDFGIHEILVSYFYIKKGLSYYTEAVKYIQEQGGLFMTDSGAFSFMGSGYTPEMHDPEYWTSYLEEYTAWLYEHRDYIYVAANLDIDMIVGRDVVTKWNEKYFKPLEKYMDIVYVVHEDVANGDPYALQHFEEYCKKHKYVGVNQAQKKHAHKLYIIAKKYGVRVHGFAWTELRLLRRYPFFSVDSTSWLSGVRYGTTYDYDGKNFRTYDMTQKFRRKPKRLKYAAHGVDIDKVTKEDDRYSVNRMNLSAWLGFRKEYIKTANRLLTTKTAVHYER